MPRLPSIGSFCWKLCCGGISCLNAALLGLVVFQTGIILYNGLGRSIPVPNALPAFLARQLAPDNISVSWESATFDLGGGCLLKNVRIKAANSSDPILSAGYLRINLALPNLLLRTGLPLEELEAIAVSIDIPAIVSDSGMSEPLLRFNEVNLSTSGDLLNIKRISAQGLDAGLIITGTVPLTALSNNDTERAFQLLPTLSKIQQSLRRIQTLNALVSLHTSTENAIVGSVAAHGAYVDFNRVGMVDYEVKGEVLVGEAGKPSLRRIQGTVRLSEIPNWPKWLPSYLGEPSYPIEVSLHASQGNGKTPNRLPDTLQTYIRNPFGPDARLDTVALNLSWPLQEHPISWRAYGPDLMASGDLALAPGSASPNVRALQARINLKDVVPKDWFPDLPSHRLLDNTSIAQIHATLTYNAESGASDGAATLEGLDFAQAFLPYVSLNGHLFQDRLQIKALAVDASPGEAIEGSYTHHLQSGNFTFRSQGTLFPNTLDYFLGNWWIGIFREFEIRDPVPADLAISGTFGDQKSIKSVVGVASQSATYKGIPIPHIRLLIRSNKDWAYLESLEAEFEQSTLTGRMAWQQGFPDDARRPMLISLKSNAPWDIIQPVSGIAALKAIDLEGTPLIELDGWIWRPPRANRAIGAIPILEIDLGLPNGTLIHRGMRFGNVQFKAAVKGNSVRVEPLSGTFANGIFTGSLTLRNTNAPQQLSTLLQFQVIDANFKSSMAELSHLFADPAAFLANFEKVGEKGQIDADFEIELRADPSDWAGTGRLSFRKARLGQIHLLGGLSKVLSGVGLGFTSLDLNSGNLQWSLADNTVLVSDSLFTGALLGLRLKGSLLLQNNELDMLADVNLLQGIMSKVLTPVSDNIQLDLTGSLANPQWSLRLSPLRWFQNRFNETLLPQP